MNNKLNEFGKVLIAEVRDNTYYYFDGYVDGIGKGNTAKKVSNLLINFTEEQRNQIKSLLLLTIDNCIYNVLDMIENNQDVDLLYKQSDIKILSDGLGGELFTEDGWISRFSEYSNNEE